MTRSLALLVVGIAAAARANVDGTAGAAETLLIRNNHELPYRGPLVLEAALSDGSYEGPGAKAVVRGRRATVVVEAPARGERLLHRTGPARTDAFKEGPLAAVANGSALELRFNGRGVGTLDLGLAVIPGQTADVDDSVRAYTPLALTWTSDDQGAWRSSGRHADHRIEVVATPYGGGWVDVEASLTRSGGDGGPAYVALLRRLTTPGTAGGRHRFNGRVFEGGDSPAAWDRDFWYTRGVDWISWRSGALAIAAINAFTPAPTIQRGDAWAESSHFYVWERTRRRGDETFLVSEIAGPNPEQAKSRYMPVTPYAPIPTHDAVRLRFRISVEAASREGWEESQLRVFAGHQETHTTPGGAVIDLGVRHVTFGTAYFPYSTLTENFDFYRTAGQDRETFWAFSPKLWAKWRALVPRMRGDLHIVRAMGFAVVRLHHLELLQKMDRDQALAFLDFFMEEARGLGLTVTIDSEGPPEWLALLTRRYAGVVTRVELENEILIQGIKPGDPERWTAQYRAAKAANSEVQVFLTSAGNHGQFERLRALGVPFDRVGLHAYKHGPQWKESFASHVLGAAGYAASLGKLVTLGEFNWKELTLLSPHARRPEYAAIFETVLAPRAIPEVIQFQLQESLSFNPAIAGTLTRHYEPLALDRRPKPEAAELKRLIREYGPADAPVRTLPIVVDEAAINAGTATASFTITNRTPRPVRLTLRALAFDGIGSRLLTPPVLTLGAGENHEGRLALTLASPFRVGTYHHFLRADHDGGSALGWGVASNPGAPTFTADPVLGDRVLYPQGAFVLSRLAWDRPLAVVFGEKPSVLEVETAYTVYNTLQSATGRPVWLSAVADLPDSIRRAGTVIAIGTPATSSIIAGADVVAPDARPKRGIVAVSKESESEVLLLAGPDREGAQAAAIDFVLRYWKNAKDATTPLSGIEPGAALGSRAGVGEVDPP